VLDEALRGGTTREIAQTLFVTEATVRTHLTRIYEKLGVRGRIELLANRLVEPALAPRGSVLAPIVSATPPSVPALEPRVALSDFIWTSFYAAALLAASGLLAYLTPLSGLLGPMLVVASTAMTHYGVASRHARFAVLTAGYLLTAEQVAVLVALRTL